MQSSNGLQITSEALDFTSEKAERRLVLLKEGLTATF